MLPNFGKVTLDTLELLLGLGGLAHGLIHYALPWQMNPYFCKSNMEYYYHQQDEMVLDEFQVKPF